MLKKESILSLSGLLELMALLTIIATTALFIFGHVAAYFYFSSFDIPYFKYTDTNTAFNFSFKSIDVFLSSAILVFIPFLLVVIPNIVGDTKEIGNKGGIWWLIYYSKSLLVKLVLLVIIIAVSVWLLVNVIISSDLKENINDRRYIPFEVSYNNGSDVVACVTTIGALGQYQVFITQLQQPILIKEESIISVRKMFSPVPIEKFQRRGPMSDNPNYDKEMKIWMAQWKLICPNIDDDPFEDFEFSKNSRNIRVR